MKKFIYASIFCILSNNIYAQNVIIIDTSENTSKKQALVILNGFGKIIINNMRVKRNETIIKGHCRYVLLYIRNIWCKNIKLGMA